MFAMTQKCETPIKISSAHADAMALIGESNSRRDYDVEFLRRDKQTARRFPDTQTVLFQLGVRRDFTKQHLCAAAQNWDENALVCAPGALDDLACVDFVTHRQVYAHQFARRKFSRANYVIADGAGCVLTFMRRHRATRCERLRSLLLHQVGHVKSPGRRRRFPPVPLPSRRSRTGATGGVSRGRNRLTVSTALLKCCRQCTTPR